MAQVSFSQTAHAEQIGEMGASAGGKNQGVLKVDGKSYSVFAFSDSEAVTEAVAKFIQEANEQQRPVEELLDYDFVHITEEMVEVEEEIAQLLKELTKPETSKEGRTLEGSSQQHKLENQSKSAEKEHSGRPSENGKETPSQSAPSGRQPVVYSSLFALARSCHATLSEGRQKKEGEQKSERRESSREEGRTLAFSSTSTQIERMLPQESRFERDGNGKQDQEKQKDDEEQEGFSQNQEERERDGSSKKQKNGAKVVSIGTVQAARKAPNLNRPQASGPTEGGPPKKAGQENLGSIENVYIRFMALMARILGQAELEAHQLYLRIKERTDAIDTLTLLLSKINAEKSGIDWTKNEEMKQLIDKARALGVEIPEGKYKWTDDEKKLLKENIQMRKDSMEKITQLERTDMQRYLQEASQCHQARSNILKMLKEVIDTIIHNFRPG